MVGFAEVNSLDYFALKVDPGKERMAESILESRHILVKLAQRTYEQTVKISRRIPAKVTRHTLLLPGIVFVAFPKDEPIPWFALRQRLHIIRGVIGVNNVPSRIRDSQKLLDLFENLAFTEAQVAAFKRVYAKGDRVRIVAGPLAGYEAVVVEATRDDLKLLCELMGRSTPINLKTSQYDLVEPIESAA